MPIFQTTAECNKWIGTQRAQRPPITERDVVARMRDGDRLRWLPRLVSFSLPGIAGCERDCWLGRHVLVDQAGKLRSRRGEAGIVDMELVV